MTLAIFSCYRASDCLLNHQGTKELRQVFRDNLLLGVDASLFKKHLRTFLKERVA